MADNNENNLLGQNDEKPIDYASLYTGDPFMTTSDVQKKDYKADEQEKASSKSDFSAASSDSVYLSGNSVYIGQESKVGVDSSSTIYGSQQTSSVYGNYSTNPVYGESTPSYQAYVDPAQVKDRLLPLAILGLVFGLLGICCNIFSFWIVNIAAIAFSVIYLSTGKDDPTKKHKGMATAGLVLGIVGFIIGIVLFVWAVYDDYKTSSSSTIYDNNDISDIINTIDSPDTGDVYDYSLSGAPDKYSSVYKSDDEVINAYIDYFTNVAKKNELNDYNFFATTFSTSSSNSTVITLYTYPTEDCWTSVTVSHYFNEDVYPYVADGLLRDRTEEYKDNDVFGEMKNVSGENYKIEYSVSDEGYINMYGVIPDDKITIEVRGHFKDKETRDYIMEVYKSYKNDINWPDIK